MMTREAQKGLGEHFLKYGAIYIFIGGLIANYVLTTSRVSQLDYRVTKVEAEQESVQQLLMDIRLDVGDIKKDIDYIKKTIE